MTEIERRLKQLQTRLFWQGLLRALGRCLPVGLAAAVLVLLAI